MLLETGDKILAEANPRNCVWGIGLDIHDPDAFDPSRWRGQNWLGNMLMEVRDEISRECGATSGIIDFTSSIFKFLSFSLLYFCEIIFCLFVIQFST